MNTLKFLQNFLNPLVLELHFNIFKNRHLQSIVMMVVEFNGNRRHFKHPNFEKKITQQDFGLWSIVNNAKKAKLETIFRYISQKIGDALIVWF